MFGDLIVNTVKNEFLSAEVKIDQVGWKSNNFFLETWSNKNYTQGWMKTCKADYLIYYFTILEEMYIMKFNMLKHWAYELKEMDKFKTKEQKKYNQLNVSVGHVVPIWKLGNMKWCTKIDLKQDDLCGEETIIFK